MRRSKLASLACSAAFTALLGAAACSGGGGGGGAKDPGFTMSRTNIGFTARQGEALPLPTNVSVTISAADAAYIVAGFPQGTTPPAWLDLALYGSGFNWTLQVSAVSTNLAPATYTATVRVLIARADQSVIGSRDIAVTYTVSPSIGVSPATLAFVHVVGGTTGPQWLDVGGSPGVQFTAAANQPWVTLGATSGTTPVSLSVALDPTGLAVGSHDATVSITGAGQTVNVPVTLVVQAAELVVNTATLSFSGVNGAPLDTQTFDVWMNNGAAVDFTATPGAGWIVLGGAAGTTPARVTVGVDPSVGPLAAGSHAAPVTVSGSFGGTPVTTAVDVQAALSKATLTVPASLLLGGPDGRDFTAKPVQVSLNTGASAYAWTAAPDAAWMSLSATSGSASATPSSIDASPVAAGLTGGTRTGSLAFTATVNGDTVTASVPVTFNLESHRLLASATGVALTLTPGASRLTRTLRVVDNLDLGAPWTATSDQAWLSVTGSGIGGGDLVLTADPNGLGTDVIRYANVTISSSDASVEGTETVRVGLWIGSTAPEASTGVTGNYTEIAADPIRPYAYVHANGSSVSVFNVYTGASVGTIPSVAGSLAGMAVSGDGARLYAVDKATWKVVPVDLDTWTVGTPFALVSTASVYPRIAWTRTGGQPVLIPADGTARDPADGRVLWSRGYSYDFSPLVAASLDGSVFCDSGCNSLSWTSLGGGTLTVSPLYGSLGDRDGALAPDGSIVYRTNVSQYNWVGYDAKTNQLVIQLGWNHPYPGNVEVGWDGRVYCGRFAASSSEPDVWVFSPAGAELGTLRVAVAYNSWLKDGELVLSGEGLRLLAVTDGELRFVTTP